VGRPVPRVEDRRFVTGNGVFVDDLRLPSMLYAALVRSRVAHARIRSIETSKAERLNGVVAALTAKDVDRLVGPVATDGGMEVPRAEPLASGKVRYYGEPVAMVIAEDRYLAYDAAELVEVEYERLEPVTDVEEALREGAPLVHEELRSNVAFTYRRAGGDVEEAFGAADVVRKYRFRIQRLAAVPMETRGVVAEYEKATGKLVVHATHQFPHDLRRWTAESLGIPLSDVRVVVHDVGRPGPAGSEAPRKAGQMDREQVRVPHIVHSGKGHSG
jgi:carbon-monoxide dehydrogenase large subunit